MLENSSLTIQIAFYISSLFLMTGMIFTLIRLAKGPSNPDRVVAIDLFAVFVMGVILLYAFYTGYDYYLNAVSVMALISFIGTVAFAQYLELRRKK